MSTRLPNPRLHMWFARLAPAIAVLFVAPVFVAASFAQERANPKPANGGPAAGIAVPPAPAAPVDLRRMYYRNPATAAPVFRVELPPAAEFPRSIKLESRRAAAADGAAASGPAPVSGTSASAPVDIALPPPVAVVIRDGEVRGYSPLAAHLRSMLTPALQQQARYKRKRARGKKARRARWKTRKAFRALRPFAEFYASRKFEPVWLSKGQWTDQARSALTRLHRANDDAIKLNIALPERLPVPTGADKDLAAAELLLSKVVARYARYARAGAINPLRVSSLITVKRDIPQTAEILARISSAEFAGDALRAYNPPHAGYVALRSKLAELRAREDEKKLPPIAFGRTLRVGMRDPRVPLIRLRLGLTAAEEGSENLYDTKVASAVARFQRSRGLRANGRLSRLTIKAMSRDNRARLINEIIANMERWRWLPANLGATHILVNVPEFRMRMFRDGAKVHSARVIVGKRKTQTPIFSDVMRYVVLNPYWNVPVSIIKKEMMPAFEKDPTYFTRNGYEVRDNGKRLVVRQPPGPRNALGYVKFLFPNRHAVYMHDTPGRHRFRYASRAFSHGCVRLQDPFKLAGIVLAGQKGWSEKRLRRMIGGKNRTITLRNKVPVHIVYMTARVDENDELVLFRDLYGHSRRLRALMGLRG